MGFCIVIGCYILLKFFYHYYTWVTANFFESATIPGQRYKKGTWAVITGSSDGIGAEFAKELAKEGFNIVLTGRSA